jgi:hypothetical protein
MTATVIYFVQANATTVQYSIEGEVLKPGKTNVAVTLSLHQAADKSSFGTPMLSKLKIRRRGQMSPAGVLCVIQKVADSGDVDARTRLPHRPTHTQCEPTIGMSLAPFSDIVDIIEIKYIQVESHLVIREYVDLYHSASAQHLTRVQMLSSWID